jgi:hypothetical protein
MAAVAVDRNRRSRRQTIRRTRAGCAPPVRRLPNPYGMCGPLVVQRVDKRYALEKTAYSATTRTNHVIARTEQPFVTRRHTDVTAYPFR